MSAPPLFSIYKHEVGHTGAACASCGRWLKWLGKEDKRRLRLPSVLPGEPATRDGEQGGLFGGVGHDE